MMPIDEESTLALDTPHFTRSICWHQRAAVLSYTRLDDTNQAFHSICFHAEPQMRGRHPFWGSARQIEVHEH